MAVAASGSGQWTVVSRRLAEQVGRDVLLNAEWCGCRAKSGQGQVAAGVCTARRWRLGGAVGTKVTAVCDN